MSYLIGADPEGFASQLGRVVSAFNLVPGDKANPYPVDKGAVQVDGMALEFNIDPASTEDEFYCNITEVVSQLRAMVPEYDVVFEPVAEFTEDYLESQPIEATRLGCEPDFNAWRQGRVNPHPDSEVSFRTGSGHLHIGWMEEANITSPIHKEDCIAVVKQLDFFLGLPSLLFDNSTKRRELYGKAGAYRPKSYGVEYRVLSNKWVESEHLTRWVYRAANAALDSLVAGNDLSTKYPDISTIINSSDVEAAMVIIKAENLEVPNALEK